MVPLQFGVPGAPELLIVGVILLLFIALPFVLAYWTYQDADRRGEEHAALWALAVGALTVTTLIGGFVALAVYIWQRE